MKMLSKENGLLRTIRRMDLTINDKALVNDIELSKYTCPKCENVFWVESDAPDYPDYCPYCKYELKAYPDD